MNAQRQIFPKIMEFIVRSSEIKRDKHLQVANLTRKTIIATYVGVADTGAKRRKGLLGRKRLLAGEGLWILPCESVHTFGMQFPIDLIYLDRECRVKKIKNNLHPWRISACFFAHSVIELTAGTVCDSQTRPGDKLEFSVTLPRDESS